MNASALTAGQKAAATRRERIAQAARGLGSATAPIVSAGQKAAETRRAKADGGPVRMARIAYAVPALPGAKIERTAEDGEIVWKLTIGGSLAGEVIQAGGHWSASTRTVTLGDRFETRQAAVSRLVAQVKASVKAGAEVKARAAMTQCPTTGHGTLLALKSGSLYCPHSGHVARRGITLQPGIFQAP